MSCIAWTRCLLLASLCCLPSFAVAQSLFIRGDVDASGGLTIADGVSILRALFHEPELSLDCLDARDVDDNDALEITDGVALLEFLFRGGPAPRSPFPLCGEDDREDELTCATFPICDFQGLGFPLADPSAVVFLLDRSGSMQSSGEFDIVKREVVRSILGFPETFEFAVVFFDRLPLQYPGSGQPALATEENKAFAIDWVTGMPGGAGSRVDRGLTSALTVAANANSAEKVIIYVGDGGRSAEVPMLLDTVREQNRLGVVIHTVGVLDVSPSGRAFLRDLAAQNGGRSVIVER